MLLHGLLNVVGPLNHTRVGNELGDVGGVVRHKVSDRCILGGNLLPCEPGLHLEVGKAYSVVDHHVMGGLNKALTVDDIGFPVVFRHGHC